MQAVLNSVWAFIQAHAPLSYVGLGVIALLLIRLWNNRQSVLPNVGQAQNEKIKPAAPEPAVLPRAAAKLESLDEAPVERLVKECQKRKSDARAAADRAKAEADRIDAELKKMPQ